MNAETPVQGMLDTNIMILQRWIDPAQLPDEMAIGAITIAELSAGPHHIRGNDQQDDFDEHGERARRLEVLLRAESEFDPGRRPPSTAVELVSVRTTDCSARGAATCAPENVEKVVTGCVGEVGEHHGIRRRSVGGLQHRGNTSGRAARHTKDEAVR